MTALHIVVVPARPFHPAGPSRHYNATLYSWLPGQFCDTFIPLYPSFHTNMMAHELPLQAHGAPHHAPAAKTRKSKHHQAKIQLPNGQKPDFGPAKQLRPPQLPNGEKPDFGTGEPQKQPAKRDAAKAKKAAASKKANGRKGGSSDAHASSFHSNGNAASDAHDARSSGKNMECYAGSSFHSSPEAVALPKPSFAPSSGAGSSPTQNVPLRNPASLPLSHMGPAGPAGPGAVGHMVPPVYHSPAQQAVHPVASVAATSGQYNLHPAFVYQGVPGAGPPRYPITSYPATKHEYTYPMPYGTVPSSGHMATGPIPAGSMAAVPPLHPYHHPYPMAPVAAPYQPQSGQRISFNDLISSSK